MRLMDKMNQVGPLIANTQGDGLRIDVLIVSDESTSDA